MPTVKRIGAYRFFFYSNEGNEPAHIHIEHRGHGNAKVWLETLEMASSKGFNQKEINRILDLVAENQQEFREAWTTYFDQENTDE